MFLQRGALIRYLAALVHLINQILDIVIESSLCLHDLVRGMLKKG
jgi:hypothetical protein